MLRRSGTALLAALAALGVALTGCSGGNGKSFSPAAATTTAATGGGATATTARTRTTSNDPFCRFVDAYHDRFGRVNLGLTNPTQLREAMQDAAGSIREAQANAPESIRADVAQLSQAFDRLLAGLTQVNFDITRLPPATLQELSNPQFAAASSRLETYQKDNCL